MSDTKNPIEIAGEREALKNAEALYWSMSTAQKGIRVALDYMASYARSLLQPVSERERVLVEVLRIYHKLCIEAHEQEVFNYGPILRLRTEKALAVYTPEQEKQA